MPDLPRDPRQLARDILSGKVRIEDLARERQRAAGIPPAPQQPLPDKIPLPRTPQPVRPQQRQMPPVRTSAPRPSVPSQRPQTQRPFPPPLKKPAARPAQTPVAQPTPAAQEPVKPVTQTPEPVAPPVVARRTIRIQQLVRSKLALRQGIVLAEILGPPVSLR